MKKNTLVMKNHPINLWIKTWKIFLLALSFKASSMGFWKELMGRFCFGLEDFDLNGELMFKNAE